MDLNCSFRDKQWKFIQATLDPTKRFVAFIGGIRSGKTFSGGRAAALKILKATKPTLGWIVSPTYPMSLVPERELEATGIMEFCVERNKADRSFVFLINGIKHRIEIKTAEYPDRLRGPGLNWVWIDEGAFIDEACWNILIGRILDTRGQIFITTTPNGRNWLYEQVYLPSISDPGYFCIKSKTEENLALEKEDITRLRSKYTSEFAKQELDAEFVSFDGLVYKVFDPTVHVIEPFPIPKEWTMYGGIDFGFNDPFVHLWVAYHDRRYYIVAEHYEKSRPLAYHAHAIRTCPYDSSIVQRYADPSNPQNALELNNYGVTSVPGKREIMVGIQRVYKLLETIRADGQPALVVFKTCVKTIDEFCKYSYEKDAKEKPRDANNHAMDALRYCISSLYQDEEPFEVVTSRWDPNLSRNERAVWEGLNFPKKQSRYVRTEYDD